MPTIGDSIGIFQVWLVGLVVASGSLYPTTLTVTHPNLVDHIWSGGVGNWSDAHHWNHTNTTAAFGGGYWIDGRDEIESLVFLDVDATVGGLVIDLGDQLLIGNNRTFKIGSGDSAFLENNGLLQTQSTGGPAQLAITGIAPVAITGAGVIQLSDSQNARIISASANATLINEGNTISGAGVIGDGMLKFSNVGLIDANLSFDLLTIWPGPAGCFNSGVMQASNAGELRIQNGTIQNAGGQIIARENSFIDLRNAAIIGGTLASEGKGVIRSDNGPVTLRDLDLDGYCEIALNPLTLLGTIHNAGTINTVAGSTTAPTDFSEIIVPPNVGDVVLTGPGLLRMGWTKIDSGSPTMGGRLIQGPDHTIAGQGLLGGNTVRLTNHGTIIADGQYPIVIDPVDNQLMVNDGVMRAMGTGGISLAAGTYRNDGTIEVLPGSKFVYTANSIENNVADSTLLGGTWRVIAGDSSALLLIPAASVFYNNADVTLSGAQSTFHLLDTLSINFNRLALADGKVFEPQSSFFINEGEIAIQTGASLRIDGSFTQTGGATLDVQLTSLSGESAAAVDVNGSVSLAGNLRITVPELMNLPVGTSFDVLSSSAIDGGFDRVSLPPGFELNVQRGTIRAVVVSNCVGDLNDNGVVNAEDLLQLIKVFGPCAKPCAGDLNQDLEIDTQDLLILLSHFGRCPGM